ncbi:MAG: hypothetical protein OEW00_14140, partial [candidate division Zixibacteria bacterium]|nr:hypothetical protein [candidate division Zixibacteria bacterium]
MKYKWHFLPVLLLCISVMFSGCPCNPFHFHSDIEVWLLSPEDGAIVHDTTVTLTWDWTRPSSGKTGHYVIWGTDVERLDWSDLMPGSTKSWPLYNLALSTKYYWRVRSIDGEQRNGTYSETWSFTTGDVVWDHGQVHSPTPDSGAVDVDTIPSFAWQVYNPDSVDFDFDLYLGTSVDPPLIEQGLDSSNFDL